MKMLPVLPAHGQGWMAKSIESHGRRRKGGLGARFVLGKESGLSRRGWLPILVPVFACVCWSLMVNSHFGLSSLYIFLGCSS